MAVSHFPRVDLVCYRNDKETAFNVSHLDRLTMKRVVVAAAVEDQREITSDTYAGRVGHALQGRAHVRRQTGRRRPFLSLI